MRVYAVLTGDIVNSTKLKPKSEKKLMLMLGRTLAPHTFEFYRGDSFQVCMKSPEKSLRLALLCRTIAVSLSEEEASRAYDVRIGIGIGTVQGSLRKLGSAKGEAFTLSGRSFDTLEKDGKRIAIATGMPMANAGLQVMADYIDAIYKDMTQKQAEVIYELLSGKTQQEAAAHLKRSKSTIHQRIISGRWPEIERLLVQFENLTLQL